MQADDGPIVVVLEGMLTAMQFPEVHGILEAAKRADARPLVVDLSRVTAIDGMVAAEIVVFLRRRLRHTSPTAAVAPRANGDWLTRAGSLATLPFFADAEQARAAVDVALLR